MRFKARRPDGLLNGNAAGQRAKLNDSRRQSIARMIKSGPDRDDPWRGALVAGGANTAELRFNHGYRYCGALTKYRNTLLEIINFPTIDFIIVLSTLRITGR